MFIHGWHTFDHTLIDLFYANLMIKVAGIIVIDDCSKPAVGKAVNYFSKYPAYKSAGAIGALLARAPVERSRHGGSRRHPRRAGAQRPL